MERVGRILEEAGAAQCVAGSTRAFLLHPGQPEGRRAPSATRLLQSPSRGVDASSSPFVGDVVNRSECGPSTPRSTRWRGTYEAAARVAGGASRHERGSWEPAEEVRVVARRGEPVCPSPVRARSSRLPCSASFAYSLPPVGKTSCALRSFARPQP